MAIYDIACRLSLRGIRLLHFLIFPKARCPWQLRSTPHCLRDMLGMVAQPDGYIPACMQETLMLRYGQDPLVGLLSLLLLGDGVYGFVVVQLLVNCMGLPHPNQ